jgi:UDP-glucuronate 4-epimerase
LYRDYTYIDDIVDGIFRLTNKIPNLSSSKKYKDDSLSHVAPIRTLNIGNTKKVLLTNFINAIEKSLGKKANKKFLPMQKGDVHSTLSDTKLLRRITGYNPKTKYQDGIRKFLDWYLDYYN